MTKFRLLFIALFFLNLRAEAQPTIQWQKCLGGEQYDVASSIRQNTEGAYFVVGSTLSKNGDVSENHGLFDAWALKIDSLGLILWEKSIGGTDNDFASDIQITPEGGYILVGTTNSNDGDVSGNHGMADAWVVKLSAEGSIQWQKCFGGSGNDGGQSIMLTSDGGIVFAGQSNSNDGDVVGNHGASDFWIVKLNSQGVIEWQKSFGGTLDDNALSIKSTSDGGYIVVGETQSNDGNVSGNNGNVDYWVVKLDNSGGLLWQKTLGGTGLDVASDVVESNDGFLICGYTGSHNSGDVTGHHSSFDYWIVKLATTGEIIWQKCFGGNSLDYARSIEKTIDGNYLVAGETKSVDGDVMGNIGVQMVWVLKINEDGALIWKKILGGTQGEGANSIRQTGDLGGIIGGFSWSNDGDVSGNHGEADFWVVKLSPESSPTFSPAVQPLEIYPNPAQSSIHLTLPLEETALSVSISDLLGRELMGPWLYKTGVFLGTIDVSALPQGLYLLKATSHTGNVFAGKFWKNTP